MRKLITALCVCLGLAGAAFAAPQQPPQRTNEQKFAEIVRSAQSIHPADRAGYIQSWSKTMGLPSSYSRGIYSNLGRSGGVNTYTARDLSKKPYQPTYR